MQLGDQSRNGDEARCKLLAQRISVIEEATHHENEAVHCRQFEDMIVAVQDDREPLVNGEESLKVSKLILAMYESARTNTPVSL
ncbi:Gfo/Idh/MocA family oxidoreductase [Alicyclobacillus fastidiosus]|uniref:Gfo/Idh/MocA family oxidoreductase n=1 Tax=Alicyclobacillus fastidiosus TaxID=392011 RepID=A0ABY6ZM38_9BACL|nr:Gfo/Idh/MocA family oxidoreductase [Alicyclobacillus fastidiosus]WAH43954.1 Gfo/Idh/MocA family oxidoreductase [Alicyclobacillus fastidiosus]GMA60212.1 hypothetical protein GCM10025859_06520 [Alicyclobacillus fastidiosus]